MILHLLQAEYKRNNVQMTMFVLEAVFQCGLQWVGSLETNFLGDTDESHLATRASDGGSVKMDTLQVVTNMAGWLL